MSATPKDTNGAAARGHRPGRAPVRAHTVFLSLGSNRGDRVAQIESAFALLEQNGVCIVKRSSLYETEPVGFHDQHWFLNCVIKAETSLMPRQLVRAAQRIERSLGRRREAVHNAPRNLDIDVLLFGTTEMHTAELEIPHPRIAERRFVLIPLAEIAPCLCLPVLHLTAPDLLAATLDRSQVRKFRAPENMSA